MTRLVLFLFICCFLFTSCVSMKPVEFMRTENFSVTGDNKKRLVQFDLVFHNPNGFGCTVDRITSDGWISNRQLFSAGVNGKVRAKSRRDFSVPVTASPANMDFGQLLETGLQLLLKDEKIPFKVSGTIRMKKFIFRKTYHFDYTQGIDKAQLKKLF